MSALSRRSRSLEHATQSLDALVEIIDDVSGELVLSNEHLHRFTVAPEHLQFPLRYLDCPCAAGHQFDLL
jgi:hypothetical protein